MRRQQLTEAQITALFDPPTDHFRPVFCGTVNGLFKSMLRNSMALSIINDCLFQSPSKPNNRLLPRS
jgi:hypothetical protein